MNDFGGHHAVRTVAITGDTVRGHLELPSDTPVLEKPFSVDDVCALLKAVRQA